MCGEAIKSDPLFPNKQNTSSSIEWGANGGFLFWYRNMLWDGDAFLQRLLHICVCCCYFHVFFFCLKSLKNCFSLRFLDYIFQQSFFYSDKLKPAFICYSFWHFSFYNTMVQYYEMSFLWKLEFCGFFSDFTPWQKFKHFKCLPVDVLWTENKMQIFYEEALSGHWDKMEPPTSNGVSN